MLVTLEDLIEKDESDRKWNRVMKRLVVGGFIIAAIATILSECAMLPI